MFFSQLCRNSPKELKLPQITEGNTGLIVESAPCSTTERPLSALRLPRWFPFLLWTLYMGTMLVIAFGFRSIGNMNVETDFYWTYIPVARALFTGKLVLDSFRGPGYEIVLALFRLLTGDFFKAGVLLSVCSAGAALWLLYRVVQRTYGTEAALLTSVFTAVSPTFFSLGYTAGTDMFYVMLALSVLYLIIRSDFTRPWMVFLAGLLAGCAYLTRYNGVAVLLAAALGILWLCDPSHSWKQRIRSLAFFLGGTAITIVPFGIYTHQTVGRFIYNDNFLNVAYEVYARGRIRWDDFWQAIAPNFHSYADVMAYDPGKFFGHIGTNVLTHGWSDLTQLVPWSIGLGALIGGVMVVREGFSRTQAMAWLFALLSYLVLVPVFYSERFALLILPFVVLLFVRFLRWKGMPKLAERWRRYLFLGVGLFTAVWACVQSANGLRLDLATEPREILQVRDAFLGLGNDSPRGASISARKPHIAHYLSLDYVPFPYVTSETELVSALRLGKVDYVYVSQYEVATRPELSELINSTKVHDGLRPLITVISPPSVLYRVIP